MRTAEFHFCKGTGKNSGGQPLEPKPKIERRQPQVGRGDKGGSRSPRK